MFFLLISYDTLPIVSATTTRINHHHQAITTPSSVASASGVVTGALTSFLSSTFSAGAAERGTSSSAISTVAFLGAAFFLGVASLASVVFVVFVVFFTAFFTGISVRGTASSKSVVIGVVIISSFVFCTAGAVATVFTTGVVAGCEVVLLELELLDELELEDVLNLERSI